MTICPCCRQPVLPGAFVVSVDEHEIVAGNVCVKLTPHEAAVLSLLAVCMPRTVLMTTIIEDLYGDELPKRPSACIKVVVHRLRKKIQYLGISIETRINQGQGGAYKLIRSPDTDGDVVEYIARAYRGRRIGPARDGSRSDLRGTGG